MGDEHLWKLQIGADLWLDARQDSREEGGRIRPDELARARPLLNREDNLHKKLCEHLLASEYG